MNSVTLPFATTTTLSVFLHGVIVAMWLLVSEQSSQAQAVGQGLNIELVSATIIASQHETEIAKKQQSVVDTSVSSVVVEKFPEKALTGEIKVLTSKSSDGNFIIRVGKGEKIKPVALNNVNLTSVTQSTNASEKQHHILELLHSHIGDNKTYPYLARRQGREGVSTVKFMLHPDGTIENTQLITSSKTLVLDRAALTAVKSISPFKAAQDYLNQTEVFKVDVVFSLL